MIDEIKKTKNNNLDSVNFKESYLSIQLSLDGFSFCIKHSFSNEIIAYSAYRFNNEVSISPSKHLALIKEIFTKEAMLNNAFKAVYVSHFNNLVTQVPKALFDKNNLADYLKYSLKVLNDDYIVYDELKNTGIVNVYIPFVNINNFLIDQYGSFIFKHSSTISIETVLNTYKNLDNTYCFVHVLGNQFELIVIKNSKLELFNSFHFKTQEDFIYYILFVAEQLNLNPEELELVLLGEIEKDSELYTICYQYIKNISFYKNEQFPELLKEHSQHSVFTLLNQFN
jgi:hypothetical protein